ncbi:MAG: AMP-binding protein [Acidimicrobiia bacterium]|nr:AMP-binding protein [Acidimicrobiia bacterium]
MSAGRPGTLPELLGRAVGAFGERDALVTAEDRLSYRELSDLVDRHAAGLVGLGVGKGTRVGLLMESSVDWVSLAFAATGLGALLVPVSTFTDAAGLAHQLRHADVAVLLASAGFLGHDYLGALGEVAPELEDGPPGACAVPGSPRSGGWWCAARRRSPAGCDGWEELERAAETVPVGLVRSLRAEVDPEDDCYLLYTSGTTAEPKGVLHRHRSVAGTGFIVGERQRLGPGDVAWSHFPLFFAAGCVNVMLGSLSHGTTLLLQPVFEPATAIELIDREGVTVWHLWPHVFKALTEHPDWGRRDHSRLHKGTGPYDLVLKVSSPDGAGGVNMYGMTETATAFTCTWADDSPEIRSSTHGEPLPGNEVRIVDPSTGAPLPTGAEGEIRVRGTGSCGATTRSTPRGPSTPTASCRPATSASWGRTDVSASSGGRRTSSSPPGST